MQPILFNLKKTRKRKKFVSHLSLHPKKLKNPCLVFNGRKAGNSEQVWAPSRTSRLSEIA
jgi:hypothetical protein